MVRKAPIFETERPELRQKQMRNTNDVFDGFGSDNDAAAAEPPAYEVTQRQSGADIAEQLQKLADLRVTGLLSDGEFAAAKQKLLAASGSRRRTVQDD